MELAGPDNDSNSKRRERLLHVATVPGVAPERLNLGTLAALVKETPVHKWAQPRLVGCLRIDDHLSIGPRESQLVMNSPVFAECLPAARLPNSGKPPRREKKTDQRASIAEELFSGTSQLLKSESHNMIRKH